MQFKIFSQIIVFILIITPTYTVFATVFNIIPVEGFGNDKIEDDLIDKNASVSKKSALENYSEGKTWYEQDFERVKDWNDFVYMDNDSAELILGIKKAGFGANNAIKDIIKTNKGKIVNEVWTKNELQAVVVDIPFPFICSFVREIESLELARYVEPNAKFKIHSVPNDPFWNLQWGPRKIAADWAWNTTTGNHEIIVAVIDTGIYWNHYDLVANYVPSGYDWVNNDTNPMDDNGHGTHCAGIIAAVFNNSIGIAGMAQVKIFAEKGLDASGWGDIDDLANAIVHAVEQNASIISMSWGADVNSKLIYEAIKFAYNSGVLLIASAGNNRNDIKSYPAAYDEVIAVSATDQMDKPAFFTNFGNWVEVAAPGVQIYSTVLSNGYSYKSGTSMSCPHVAGLAALVWNSFPNMTRDQVRFHLLYTADDLGNVGFDEYYGYGRINAGKAVNQSLPAHDLLVIDLKSPPYVEINSTGVFNVTILNYGAIDEYNITLHLLANNTYIFSENIAFLPSGLTASVSLSWTPTIEGLYNITVELLPGLNETMVENNFIEVYVYGGTPLKASVIRSSGNFWTWITRTWEELNQRWFEFGNTSIFIESTSLDKNNITYEDLANTNADVLIISSAYSPEFDWEFSDSEIDAITKYVYEGHGLIVTAETFYFAVPNNNKLARLLGIDETTKWNTTITSSLNLLRPEHPLFRNIPNPYTMTTRGTVVPRDNWIEEVLVGGEYLALGSSNESAIVTYRGLVYCSLTIDSYATRNDLQLLYNAITWSHYENPEHDLIVGLDAPPYLLPTHSIQLNATVSNIGINNETGVELQLLIDDNVVDNITIPELTSNSSYMMNYVWSTFEKANHNVTVYASPVIDEDNLLNNRITRFVTVSDPIIQPVEGQWANYTLHTFTEDLSIITLINFTYNHYVSPYTINVTYWHSSLGYEWTTSSIVNVMNRQVERGTWMGLFYPAWIETNVTLGSKVRVLNGVGTIVGSQKTNINNRSVEYWSLFISFPYQNYTFFYDKTTGLQIGHDRITIGFEENLQLTSTSILIGALIYPKIGDYAKYDIVYFGNNSVTANGTMNFSYLEFLDSRRVKVQVDYALYDIYGQLVENFTELIVVNIQTRIIENGSTGWNNTYYFSWIETDIDFASSVEIWNQTGTVIGTAKYTNGQHLFDTWLIYTANETHLCLYNYDKASGILVKSTASNLNNPSQKITLTLLQTNTDFTPPTISITNPKNNTFIGSTLLQIIWAGSDNESGIAYYLVYLDSVEIALCQHDVYTYLFTDLTEGSHIIKVEAYDLAGNMNSAEITVINDLTAAIAYIIAPSNGSYVNGVVNINFSGYDEWFDFMQLFINDVPKAMFYSSGNYTYLWDTTAYNDGLYIILLEVWDKAYSRVIHRIEVTVDNTEPIAQIVQTAEYVKATHNMVVYAYDINLKNASFSVNGQIIDTWNSSGIHTSVWNTTAFLDGVSTVEVNVFDKAENNKVYSMQIVVDNTLPTAEITSPTNGTYVSGTSYINFTLSDENLEGASLIIDGKILADVTNSTYYEWNTTETVDGQHVLLLKVVDKAGNTKTSSITIVIDNTKPIIGLTSPINGTIISGNMTITFMTWDENLKNTTLILDQTTFNVTNITSLTLDTKTLQDDIYTVRLITFDLAENQVEESITIIVDNTNPNVAISTPADGTQLQGTININFTGSDVHLVSILLYIDNMVFNVTSQTFFQWNTTKMGDGIHKIKIVAFDSAGNNEETEVSVWTINVQKAREDSYLTGRNLGILVGILLGLIVSIAFVVALKYLRSVNLLKSQRKEIE